MNNQNLFNEYVIRSFRDVADRDYIAARLAFRADLVPQFLWQSQQAIEKYLKCILALNKIDARNDRHDFSKLLKSIKKIKFFKLSIDTETLKFIDYLDRHALNSRYGQMPCQTFGEELFKLDKAVWGIRLYARVLNYSVKSFSGNPIALLDKEIESIERARLKPPHEFSIIGGYLESVLAKRSNDPARQALVWHNLMFGKRSRRAITFRPAKSTDNMLLSYHPDMFDEVEKYVFFSGPAKKYYSSIRAEITSDFHEA